MINLSNNLCSSELSFGYYKELSQSRSVDDLKQRIEKIIKRLGFSDYSYIQLAKACTTQSPLCTLPEELVQKYFDNHLYTFDMSLQRAINSEGSFFQSTIHDYLSKAPFVSEMTYGMDVIYKLNKFYGYYDYFHVGTRDKESDDPVLLSVAQRGASPIELKATVEGCESTIVLLCEAINFMINKHFKSLKGTKSEYPVINPKPLRVLHTLANNDLTIEQVADKLNISTVTANQHLRSVRIALGTKTNYAAIKKALLEKLIRLEKTSTTVMEYIEDGS